jgi:hypothetical protein
MAPPARPATPYDLPYKVRVQPPPLLSGGGVVALRVMPAKPADAAADADYAGVVTAFALLASTGALAGAAGLPAAGPALEWSRAAGRGLEWTFTGCAFDERAAVLLAQMFLLCHPTHPLDSITLTEPGRPGDPLVFDPRLEDPYPAVWQPTPFPVALDPAVFDTATLRVRFARTPTPEEQAEIDAQIITWAVATAMGAYGIAPVPPVECSAKFEPGVTFLGDELEFELLRLRSHRGALRGLVNVCTALHQTVLPITDLRID